MSDAEASSKKKVTASTPRFALEIRGTLPRCAPTIAARMAKMAKAAASISAIKPRSEKYTMNPYVPGVAAWNFDGHLASSVAARNGA